MDSYREIYSNIVENERYKRNILYGQPRRGHAEGAIKAHIAELEQNLETLRRAGLVDDGRYWKLMVLIHVHDSFKAESKRDAAIIDPQSHASLARAFLAEHTSDLDMLNIAQYHDIGYAIYRKFKTTGRMDDARIETVLAMIRDLDLFLLFAIIDACTASKGREMIAWFVNYVNWKHPSVSVGASHIIPQAVAPPAGEW